MTRRAGLLVLMGSLLIAALSAALVIRKLAPRRAPETAGFEVKLAPPVRVRLNERPVSVTIDLPGDPILVRRRSTGAPRDLSLALPTRPGAPIPPAPARAFFVSSPLALSEAGAMLKYSDAGRNAQALRAQLADNMAALAGASGADMATDDDGGVATPENAESAALTDKDSNRLIVAPAEAASVRSVLVKAVVESRISDLLARNGFTDPSAREVEQRIQAIYGLRALAIGGALYAAGARDPAGGYRVTQVALYQGREYLGAVGLAENGAYAEAAAPNLPEDAQDDDLVTVRYRLVDGIYSAGLAEGAPEAVVREAIQLLAARVDLGAGLASDASLSLLYSGDFRDHQKLSGRVVYARVRNGQTDYACYPTEGGDGVFRCFDPRGAYEELPPLPPSRPGIEPLRPDIGGASRGGVLAPIRGAPITSLFGMRFHPILHYWRLHAGVDFGAPVGSPVRAAADGEVEIAGPVSGYGDHVRIKHDGFETSYSHLSEIPDGVEPGAHVKQGQLIAYSGNTGLSTGPHLHFEYHVDGEAVDPMPHLGSEIPAAAPLVAESTRPAAAPLEARMAPTAEALAFPAYKALVDKALAAL